MHQHLQMSSAKSCCIFSLAVCILALNPQIIRAQTGCPGGYITDGDETPCGSEIPCCLVPYACNGPNSGCNNYDPDFASTNGCDMSCTGGCMDSIAINYDSDADFDDLSCLYEEELSSCPTAYNPDYNCDSLINYEDFLEFLTFFGEEFIPTGETATSDSASSVNHLSLHFEHDTLYLIQNDSVVLNQVYLSLCCAPLQAAATELDDFIGHGIMETTTGTYSSYANGPSTPTGNLFPATTVPEDSVFRFEYVYQQGSGCNQKYSLRVDNKLIWNGAANQKTNFWVFPGNEISMSAGGFLGCTGNYSVNWLVTMEKFALSNLSPDTLMTFDGNVSGVLQNGETTGEPFQTISIPSGWKYHLRWFHLTKGGVCHNSNLRIDGFSLFPNTNEDLDLWLSAGTTISMQHGGFAGCNGSWNDSYYLQIEGFQVGSN